MSLYDARMVASRQALCNKHRRQSVVCYLATLVNELVPLGVRVTFIKGNSKVRMPQHSATEKAEQLLYHTEGVLL